jgi:hypothetical protein
MWTNVLFILGLLAAYVFVVRATYLEGKHVGVTETENAQKGEVIDFKEKADAIQNQKLGLPAALDKLRERADKDS